jgi:precorrin-3B C17-methyltransferase
MIYVVGLGPGDHMCRTAAATAAIQRADALVGYAAYIDLVRGEFPEKPVFENGMMGEVARCQEAIRLSREGKTVAVVCSGDASVYGMASLILELSDEGDVVEIVPGVTAALAASALLGAPLSGDLAIVSLSDLLTPWAVIEKRLDAAGLGDFPVALYNPASRSRSDHLQRAVDILLGHKPGGTPCGWVRNIARDGEERKILTLAELRDEKVDMFTTAIVGSSQTVLKNGRLVTLRGYRT